MDEDIADDGDDGYSDDDFEESRAKTGNASKVETPKEAPVEEKPKVEEKPQPVVEQKTPAIPSKPALYSKPGFGSKIGSKPNLFSSSSSKPATIVNPSGPIVNPVGAGVASSVSSGSRWQQAPVAQSAAGTGVPA